MGSRGCAVCRKKEKKRQPRRKKKIAAKTTKRSWEQDDVYDGLDLPTDDFDYDEFCKKEFGKRPAHQQIGIRCYWWLTAVILIGLFAWMAGAWVIFS